jgi:beta-xylosidase
MPSAGEGEFLNPVIATDFPDPHVILADDDMYYAYATTGGGANIRVARSPDLVGWAMLGDALPELASWSGLTPLFEPTPHRATWAPEVAQIDGSYVMYYTTPAVDIPRPDNRPSQCIGTAVSDAPEGPFVDSSDEPIVCQSDLGGSIDATFFRDEDGTQYLVWKNDGNCCARPTRFFIQELAEDGLEVVGEPTDMGVSNDQPWERYVIEAPTLVVNDGTYYLFYSGNDFASAAYAVGYATADEVLGPYVDAEENPILKSDPPAAGPGHQSVVEDRDGNLWMTYHAWDFSAIGYGMGGRRAMWIDQLSFEDGRAVVDGPDVGPQEIP